MSNSIRTYKITCTTANTAFNVVTGTVSSQTTIPSPSDKGRGIVFQCQTNGAIGFAGGNDVVSVGGISFLGPDGSYTPVSSPTPCGYNANDWWVASDTAGAIIVVQLIRSI